MLRLIGRRHAPTAMGFLPPVRTAATGTIRLSVGADEEIVAAAIDESNFLVEGDGTGVSFPHAVARYGQCRRANRNVLWRSNFRDCGAWVTQRMGLRD
jgi:hypothetical protein